MSLAFSEGNGVIHMNNIKIFGCHDEIFWGLTNVD